MEYVYNGKLVRKTGRTASKPGKVSNRRNTGPVTSLILHEIESIDDPIKWKEWVKEDDLYVVHSVEDSDNNSEDVILLDNGSIKSYNSLLEDTTET